MNEFLKWLFDAIVTAMTKRNLQAAGAGPDAMATAMTVSTDLGSGYDRPVEEQAKRQAICDYAAFQIGVPYKLGAEIDLDDL